MSVSTRPISRNAWLLGSLSLLAALLLASLTAAAAAASTKRFSGAQGEPDFILVERADGSAAVQRFQLKRLPVTCVIGGAEPVSAQIWIVVRLALPVDPATGRFAGTQRTSTDQLDELPESASVVTTSVKGAIKGGARSAAGLIRLRDHSIQLVPGGRVISDCATDGWLPWRASGPVSAS